MGMGEFYALLTALLWAGAVICFKLVGSELPPLVLNLFRVAVSGLLFVVTMIVVGEPPWRTVSGTEFLVVVGSGVIGIVVADTLFHASLNRIGAGLTAVVDCLYPPLTALIAVVLIGEHMSRLDLVGMAFVVGGVLLTTGTRLPPGRTRRDLVVGLALGAAGMVTLALGIVMVKPVLAEQPVIWVTGMRQFVATAVLWPLVAWRYRRTRPSTWLRPSRRTWWLALLGTLLGSYLALVFWIAGMKYATAGVAAVLNQTSTAYILVLATWVLGESFTRRKALACCLALVGALVTVV